MSSQVLPKVRTPIPQELLKVTLSIYVLKTRQMKYLSLLGCKLPKYCFRLCLPCSWLTTEVIAMTQINHKFLPLLLVLGNVWYQYCVGMNGCMHVNFVLINMRACKSNRELLRLSIKETYGDIIDLSFRNLQPKNTSRENLNI